MNRADRFANLILFALAVAAWVALIVTFLTLDPVGNTAVLLAGGLLLGGAVALTVVPVLWLAGFMFRGPQAIAYRGDWWRAARRGLLAGLAVSLLVILRGEGLLTPPIALFVVAMAAIVELSLAFRR